MSKKHRTTEGKVEGAVATFDDITARKESEEALAEELRGMAILQRLGARFVTEDNIETIYEDILSAAMEITRATAGTVQILDNETEELVVLATRGFSKRTEEYFHRVGARSSTSCGRALRSGERSDVNFDPASTEFPIQLHVADGIGSAQSSILLSRTGKPIGMVSTHWAEMDHRPSERELRFLDLLVRQAADLIEQRRSEEALRESESRLRIASEAAELGVFEWHPSDGSVTWENDRMFEIFGRSREEGPLTMAMFLANVVNPDDAGRFKLALETSLSSGQLRYTGRFSRADGAQRWVMFSGKVEYAQDGTPSRMPGVAADVTERQKSDAALRDSLRRFRALAQTAGNTIYRMSRDWRLMYELDSDNLAPTPEPIENWIEKYIPEEDLLVVHAAIAEAVRGKSTFELEHRVRRADGSIGWVLSRAVPLLDADDEIAEWFGAGVDVTDRRQAADRLRESENWQQTLVEGVPQLVWRAIDGGEWTWASPQWTRYTGQSEVESHGWGWLEHVHPDDRARAKEAWDGAVDRGGFHADYRIHHVEENRYRWFQTRATPVRGEKGEILEWLGTSTDVDDLRQLQERQQVLVAELQHRTFNLMGMIRSTADATIRSSVDLEDFKSKFNERIAALARVQRLLSRVTDDDRVKFDMLIREELEAVGALPDGHRLILEGPAGVSLRSGTVQTFAMALHELTTNAVKYGALAHPEASLCVRWWLADGEDGQPWLNVEWRETSVPMAAADERLRGTGQGRALIEEALPYQLGARTSYLVTADGIHCSIALPVSARTKADP